MGGCNDLSAKLADLSLITMCLRGWHGVVPKETPLFSVGKRDTLEQHYREEFCGRAAGKSNQNFLLERYEFS
jgi:hypothetical protein